MTLKPSTLFLIALYAVILPAGFAHAQSDGNQRMSVTVAFGAGLNTPPGSPANHHVLPNTIEVKAGGVVNFAIAGFHQIVVYNPGVDVKEIVLPTFVPPTTGLFVNYALGTAFYVGIDPNNQNPVTPDAPATVFNGNNRMESVVFHERGLYLVICNVTPHLRNGMYAYVKVSN